MPELLPTWQAEDLVDRIDSYLTTTFALSDPSAQEALTRFLRDPENGMFKGPYLRLRLPFEPAGDGWREALDWYGADFPPYGHQARAFERLTSKGTGDELFRRPEPTLVTTGTGSGKTESFLFPIIDHVLRAQQAGITGTKALILYPMNALANDQAGRLAQLLSTHEELSGIRAALYTGEGEVQRSTVTRDGLINDRQEIRKNPPDILLTNYKMLDMLLLRHEDSRLWQESALSLQYLVLDEFHTYDGAQGTDVAMLLRRLGHALTSNWPQDLSTIPHGPTEEDRARPLGRVTPVATSATLGGSGGADDMLGFAKTIFGEAMPAEALITESRMSPATWQQRSPSASASPRPVETLAEYIAPVNARLAETSSHQAILDAALDALFEGQPSREPEGLLAALRHHPLTQHLLDAMGASAVGVRDLAQQLFLPLPREATATLDDAAEFLSHLLALYSHVRAVAGREALTVETHLWVRELSRIDSAVDTTFSFRWSDDGVVDPETPTDAVEDPKKLHLPAIYCRHCGRVGWGSRLAPTETEIITDADEIRQTSAQGSDRFRPLMHAAADADEAQSAGRSSAETKHTGLRYLHTVHTTLAVEPPEEDDEDFQQGYVIPVKTHVSAEAEDHSKDDRCPACMAPDAIRFVGSAIATLTSVAVSNLFGTQDLDAQEKKALVFTDSVQDAAHRAGFIQARSHTFTLRNALRTAFGQGTGQVMTLSQLVDRAMLAPSGEDETSRRFQLVPPELVERNGFREFWEQTAAPRQRQQAATRVKRRLLFDASLELGLQARLGRTLELTGTVVAEVDAGSRAALLKIARRVWDAKLHVLPGTGQPDDQDFLRWVRGVLVRMRLQGGIDHPWLESYIRHDGARYHIWGGRRRDEGMPAFPDNRPAPAFPVVGKTKPDNGLDPVTPSTSWYTQWTNRTLGVSRDDAAHLVRELLEDLGRSGILTVHATDPGGQAFAIDSDRIVLSVPEAGGTHGGLATGDSSLTLRCSVCQSVTLGTADVVDQLAGAPCLQLSCAGKLAPEPLQPDPFYRSMYENPSTRRVVAREHTSLLDDAARLDFEQAFKQRDQKPEAPNVLVATPTLEMGIDIGDLSCVMLASMPKSVANYVQRVGRAGRLTGNSLVLAFARGRGEHLPKVYDPLSVINGDVTPPATYLQAQEILARQFTAFVADQLARDPQAPHPASVRQALGDSSSGTYLGEMLSRVDEHGDDLLTAFLDRFGEHVDDVSAERLRAWAREELPHVVHAAAQRWQQDQEELQQRIKDIEATLEDLEQELQRQEHAHGDADHPTVREAYRDVKAARAQRNRLIREAKDERSEYWLSALEEYGLFPNYTLIGDSVTLDVGVSWRDEESGDFVADSESFSRASGVALQELAPGATFYARGMQIAVDAVELGPDAREIEPWQICPSCGWHQSVQRISETPVRHSGTVSVCPRCGAQEISDVGQIHDVVLMRKVSAEISRDEAVISDAKDERERKSFEVVSAADVDPAEVVDPWSVEGTGLGVQYLQNVDLTWYNLGAKGRGGGKQAIAGHDVTAPLFTVCEYCGKQDRSVRDNKPGHHRFWCKHRTSSEEHNRTILLARTLSTQGVCLTLPAEAMAGDSFAAPTMKAVLLMGLQRHLGGTPGALGVMTAQIGVGEERQEALLVHDVVPGGTGYLSIFRDPQKVFGALRAAWDTVRECPCQDQERRACHRCLLPFADYGAEDLVSRVAAERLLAQLLGADDATPEPTFDDWTIQHHVVATRTNESHLEIDFRRALKERLSAVNAQVIERPGPKGEELVVVLPGSRLRWQLLPQIDVDGTRPDFLLRADDRNLPDVAVYTDGRTYHADLAHNRVGDDAVKRHRLRRQGYIPWGITHEDIVRFTGEEQPSDDSETWLERRVVTKMTAHHTLSPTITKALHGGSMELLWTWLTHPEYDDWQKIADVAPTLAMTGMKSLTEDPIEQPIRQILPESRGRTPLETMLAGSIDEAAEARQERWWQRSSEALTLLSVGNPLEKHRSGAVRSVLVLDDRPDALHAPNYAASWRRWLYWSNLLAFRDHPDQHLPMTVSSAETILAEAGFSPASEAGVPAPAGELVEQPTPDALPDGVPEAWRPLFEDAYDEERELLERLVQIDGVPVPEMGEEIQGLMPLLAWPAERVAILEDGDDGRELVQAGWTVVSADDVDAAADALRRGDERKD